MGSRSRSVSERKSAKNKLPELGKTLPLDCTILLNGVDRAAQFIWLVALAKPLAEESRSRFTHTAQLQILFDRVSGCDRDLQISSISSHT